jgi:23S rRNA (cytidine2498-2'-O)-methyltransferase
LRIVAYCRSGFEPEAAADIRRAAARAGDSVDIASTPLQGFVIATTNMTQRDAWRRALVDAPAVFARSVFTGEGPFKIADADSKARADRVTPLLQAIRDTCTPPWRSVWIEYPDTNEGKALSALARALTARIEPACASSLRPDAKSRLRIFVVDGTIAYVGESDARVADWPLGIPRLRMPPGAPSRSTLKLAEAFEVFLGANVGDVLRAGDACRRSRRRAGRMDVAARAARLARHGGRQRPAQRIDPRRSSGASRA